MELTKFCPRCGEEVEELHGEKKKYCPECYPDVNDLLEVPSVVEITVCGTCGRMRKSGEWLEEYSVHEQLSAKFSEFSEPGIEMELQFWEEDEKMFVRLHASKDDLRDEYDSEVRFNQEQCEECSKFHGGFYKVKMQLRGEELKPISDSIADRAAEITNENRKNFLANIEETEHGFNFFISTEDMAKEILDMLRARHDPEIKRSYELLGEEDGQEVYRNVISVRID